jgi:hypothetical protein
MYRTLVKEWVIEVDHPFGRWSQEARAAIAWCADNTSSLVHVSEGRIVFRDEADALMYWLAWRG